MRIKKFLRQTPIPLSCYREGLIRMRLILTGLEQYTSDMAIYATLYLIFTGLSIACTRLQHKGYFLFLISNRPNHKSKNIPPPYSSVFPFLTSCLRLGHTKIMAYNHDVIVIGAGAAGMMAAGRAAELGAKVLLLEKMARPGNKILISGNGRCNLTNSQDI